MLFFTNIGKAVRQVYGSKGYYVLTGFVAILLYVANPLVRNFSLLREDSSLAWSLIVGFPATSSNASLIMLLLLAALSGVIVAMSVFLLRRQVLVGGHMGAGMLISIVAPACHSCALGLLGLVGLSGLIGLLPFQGLEIGVAGIVLLVISIGMLSKKIVTDVCEIKEKKI